ncbi:MAG: GntR family transcriptional regulator [Nocardioidaceae bacterium]
MNQFETLSLEHSSTVDRVADELRRALFDGEVGAGTPLREIALAEAMGVSRSTIREALGALVGEGLATRAPNRGVHVTALDAVSVRDVFAARQVLEVAGVRRWAGAGDEARATCRQAMLSFNATAEQDAGPAELTAAHLAVHLCFVGLTGSSRLVALAETLASEIRLALATVDRIRRDSIDHAHAHADLFGLLEAGDLEGAASELQHHLASAERSLLAALDLA